MVPRLSTRSLPSTRAPEPTWQARSAKWALTVCETRRAPLFTRSRTLRCLSRLKPCTIFERVCWLSIEHSYLHCLRPSITFAPPGHARPAVLPPQEQREMVTLPKRGASPCASHLPSSGQQASEIQPTRLVSRSPVRVHRLALGQVPPRARTLPDCWDALSDRSDKANVQVRSSASAAVRGQGTERPPSRFGLANEEQSAGHAMLITLGARQPRSEVDTMNVADCATLWGWCRTSPPLALRPKVQHEAIRKPF